MGMIKYFNRIQRMDQLIRFKSTGKPSEFAKKMEISERWLYELLNEMREMGAKIEFDKQLNSYVYTIPGEFIINFQKF